MTRKNAITISGVAVIIIIGIIMYFSTLNNATPLNVSTTNETQSQTSTSSIQQATMSSSTDETADWKTYLNAKHGLEFKYPSNWIIDVNDDSGFESLDIHLSNMQPSDMGCSNGYSGLEAMVSNSKDSKMDFSAYVNSRVSKTVGLSPSGKIEELSVNEQRVYKIEYSGWDSGCKGPGYFIEQKSNKFTYVFTGNAKDSKDAKTIEMIINTFKFTK